MVSQLPPALLSQLPLGLSSPGCEALAVRHRGTPGLPFLPLDVCCSSGAKVLTWIPPLQHLSRCHGDPCASRRKFSTTHTPMCLLGGRRGRFLGALLSPLMHKELTCSCNDVVFLGMALLSSTEFQTSLGASLHSCEYPDSAALA